MFPLTARHDTFPVVPFQLGLGFQLVMLPELSSMAAKEFLPTPPTLLNAPPT